ncbi:D-ribose pyranase [Solibacillus isronensis]|uniref:D-ribose pyranase n=1 Tax=Solibacillus isronensis TaxID=412383 RepID=UPI0009A7F440|nr:D-ribose pyranase [Solibacillus isronensis]
MKKQGILNRELAGIFARLGHTDKIVIADCGLPIPDGVTCIDLAYKLGEPGFMTILEVVLEDLQVEHSYLAEEIVTANETIHSSLLKIVEPVTYISHKQFKKMSSEAKVIIRTGEMTPYANIMLQSGVIF